MQLIPNWFCFMQMRHMYICWISGFFIWPTTSPDRFIMNWAEFQSALKGCHSINLLYDNLLSVSASRFWLCVLFQWSLNNVSMQQRSEAIPDTSLPLTKHQQNFLPSLYFSSSLQPVLFRWLAVFTWWSSLALGTGERRIREMKLGEKRKTRQWPWLGRWVNDQTPWQRCACVCVYAKTCVWVWGKVGVKQ